MANYLARVELHQATAEDYERLHGSMRQRGYLREITGEDGVRYQLPAGSYYVTDSSAVLSVALNAAAETGKQAAIFVTDWHAVRWMGLAKA